MPVAQLNGVELYYEQTGQGFPLVWSHEFGGDYRSWEPQVRYFARRYRVITYNHRGYPPSSVPKEADAYDNNALVEDLHQLLRHLGIARAHVGGLSMGGNVALNFGIRHPEMAASLIVAGCGSGGGTGAAATDESSAPLTKKRFVTQASQICEQGLKEKDAAVSSALQELASEAKGAPTSQQVGKMVEEKVIPAYDKLVEQLSGLGAPKGDEAKIKKMVGEYEAALQATEAEPAKATKENPFAGADEAAGAYGLESCRL